MGNNIELKELENIREKLEALNPDEAVFIDDEGQTRYAIIPIMMYDMVEELMAMRENGNGGPKVIVTGGQQQELSYEEYERVKFAIMEMLETTLKPKAEKLN